MDSKLIGSILLIVGTTIGAGMLALPIATAELGFIGSVLLLIAGWAVMTTTAFLLLEANLWLPSNSNIISMARATLGGVGEIICWISYLMLLYALLCAYIAGGSDLLLNLLSQVLAPVLVTYHLTITHTVAAIVFTLLFGFVVYLGIRTVDYINRGLMFVKLSAFFLLVLLLAALVSPAKLVTGNFQQLESSTAWLITITAFGYATLIPSLRVYFAGNIKKLKLAILIGGLIPLICYIAWDMVIMGIIPIYGENSLFSILQSNNSTSGLLNGLGQRVPYQLNNLLAHIFMSICVLTSFLGVGLCLVDFWSDGLRLDKTGGTNIFLHILTFFPPLLVVLFFPNMFIKALEYAGIDTVILLVFLPVFIVWSGRYHKKFMSLGFKVVGGKPLLAIIAAIAIGLIIKGIS